MPEDKRHVGAKAQRNAVNALIESHRTEYDTILGQEREKLGLPREAAVPKKPSKLDVLREQIRAAGQEPKI